MYPWKIMSAFNLKCLKSGPGFLRWPSSGRGSSPRRPTPAPGRCRSGWSGCRDSKGRSWLPASRSFRRTRLRRDFRCLVDPSKPGWAQKSEQRNPALSKSSRSRRGWSLSEMFRYSTDPIGKPMRSWRQIDKLASSFNEKAVAKYFSWALKKCLTSGYCRH